VSPISRQAATVRASPWHVSCIALSLFAYRRPSLQVLSASHGRRRSPTTVLLASMGKLLDYIRSSSRWRPGSRQRSNSRLARKNSGWGEWWEVADLPRQFRFSLSQIPSPAHLDSYGCVPGFRRPVVAGGPPGRASQPRAASFARGAVLRISAEARP